MKKQKYQNQKVTAPNGEKFDSRKEMARYAVLKLLEEKGGITNLERQVKFILIPTQYDQNGKCIEKTCTYKADFVYRDMDGHMVVEDVKGFRTEVYKIKKKLMLHKYGIRIKEV